jgi:hypothetical protein
MRLVVLAVLAVSCSKRDDPPPPPVNPPPPAFDACAVSMRAIGNLVCTSPEAKRTATQAQQSLAGIVDAFAKTGRNADRYQAACAQMVVALDHDAAKLGCTLELATEERTKLRATLDAYYAHRTPVRPTGDPASDTLIKRAAVIRDTACACTDVACLDGVTPQLDTLGGLPPTAPASARELAGALLDDIGRCAQRIKGAL